MPPPRVLPEDDGAIQLRADGLTSYRLISGTNARWVGLV